MSNELDVIFPAGKAITVGGIELTLKPFRFGDLPKVFKAADPMLNAIFSAISAGGSQFETFSKIIGESGDNAIDLMVIGSKQPRNWVEDLDMSDGIDLLVSIIEVNADFFVRKVLPGLNKRMEHLVGGQTQ